CGCARLREDLVRIVLVEEFFAAKKCILFKEEFLQCGRLRLRPQQGYGRKQFHQRRMFRIQPEVAVGPRAICGKDVIALIPRLRFSSHRKEQLKAENNQQDADTDYFTCVESHSRALLLGRSQYRNAVASGEPLS